MSKPVVHDSKSNSTSSPQDASSIFDEIEKSINQYHQSAANLQRECTQYYRKVFENAMSMQQEIASKSGMSSAFDVLQKTLSNYLDATGKIYSVQTKSFITNIETARQNLKSLNENSKTLSDLNRAIMQSWSSFYSPKQE